jgi:hypothetical protein
MKNTEIKSNIMRYNATFILIPLFGLLISCNADATKDEDSIVIDTPKEVLEDECPYDARNDISDSLILILDEIMQKESEFDDEKYNSRMKRWGGKSITLDNLKVHIVSKPNGSKKASIVLQYATKDKGRVGRTDIHLFVRVNSIELKNYIYGDRVTLKGVLPTIDDDYNPKSRSDKTLALYYIHLDCGSLE